MPLTISLQGSSGQIVGLQFDISYDASTLAMNVTPGAQIQAATKGLYVAAISSGRTRILIAGVNQTVISSGVVANLFLNVAASAQTGDYRVILDNAVAVDPGGQAIPISGSAATLTLTGGTGDAPQITSSGVLNAASLISGPVAPGELITIFGTGIGPSSPAGAIILPDGTLSTNISATSASFDGVPAPMLFTSFSQLNLVVPYEVSGHSTTNLVVQYGNSQTMPLALGVAPTAPGIFTQTATGTGQAVVLNADGTLNSPSNPAQTGSEIAIFATGGGKLTPGAATGQITSGVPGQLSFPASVSFSGIQAGPPLYAGAAPSLVSGVVQVNVQIPIDCPTGPAIPLVLTIGGVSAGEGTVISVR